MFDKGMFNSKFLRNLKVGNTFVIVGKYDTRVFKKPIEFKISKIENVEFGDESDPYVKFEGVKLTSVDGLEIIIDDSFLVTTNDDYELYVNYQEWVDDELKNVENKIAMIKEAKKYLKEFKEFYLDFFNSFPEKMI